MFIFIRYQRFWPIAIAHSAWDLALFNEWTILGGFSAILLGACLFTVSAKHPGNNQYRRRAAAMKRELTIHAKQMRGRTKKRWKRIRVVASQRLVRSSGS